LTGDEAAPAFSNEFQVDTVNRNGDTTRTVATEEYVSKQTSFRWGNAQIILSLVEAEVLPLKGRAPYTSGWSIIRVATGEGAVSYYARHTDKTWVALEGIGLDLASVDDSPIEASTVTQRTVTTTVFDLTGEGMDTVAEAYTFTKTFVGMGIGRALLGVDLTGVLSGSFRNVVKSERVVFDPELGAETFLTNVLVPGALRLTGCVGSSSIALFDETTVPGFIQGTISTTAATIQNLDTFLPPPPDALP
jgi:hypothetical protein